MECDKGEGTRFVQNQMVPGCQWNENPDSRSLRALEWGNLTNIFELNGLTWANPPGAPGWTERPDPPEYRGLVTVERDL